MPRRNDKRDAILSDIANKVPDDDIMTRYGIKKNVLSRYNSSSSATYTPPIVHTVSVEEHKGPSADVHTHSDITVTAIDAPHIATESPHVPHTEDKSGLEEPYDAKSASEKSPSVSSSDSKEDKILDKIDRDSETISDKPKPKSYLMPIGTNKSTHRVDATKSFSLADKYRAMRPPPINIPPKISRAVDHDVKSVDIIAPRIEVDEKTLHQDMITRIRNYSVCYEQELMSMFGPTKASYEKFFRDRIFSMSNQQLESILERIRVNVNGNSNHQLLLRASEIVSGIIEMLLTKKNLSEDPHGPYR
jgi:hypothetical protein